MFRSIHVERSERSRQFSTFILDTNLFSNNIIALAYHVPVRLIRNSSWGQHNSPVLSSTRWPSQEVKAKSWHSHSLCYYWLCSPF